MSNLLFFFIRGPSQKSRKPLPLQEFPLLPLLRTLSPLYSTLHIQQINLLQRQLQKLMLIRPSGLTLGKTFRLTRLGWGIGDLGDEIGSGCFCNAVDENAEKGNLEEDVEADAEAEQEAFPVAEPAAFLLFGEANSGEVGFQLKAGEGICD